MLAGIIDIFNVYGWYGMDRTKKEGGDCEGAPEYLDSILWRFGPLKIFDVHLSCLEPL